MLEDYEKALERQKEEEKAKKMEQWQNLKTVAPEEAERIKAFGDAFGKLAKVRVEIDGKLIIDWW